MGMRTAVLSAAVVLIGSAMLTADENRTLSNLVQSEVTACTERALGNDLAADEMFSWPFECARRGHSNCVAAALEDDDFDNNLDTDRICHELGRASWKASADRLRQQLLDRWQKCDLPTEVRSSMAAKLARLDAAAGELNAARCDYDLGQWNAVGQPGIAAQRGPRCLAEGEYTRAAIFYQLVLKYAGCEIPVE